MEENIESYIGRSRASGALDSEGHFTVDLESARHKLAQSRLPDARFYILKLVQWAVASQATWVDVEVTRSFVAVKHNGRPLGQDEICKLSDLTVNTEKNRALSHLIVGLQAARGLGAQDVSLRTSEGQGYKLTSAGAELIAAKSDEAQQSLHITGIGPTRSSLKTLGRILRELGHAEPDAPSTFLRDLASLQRAEAALLRITCRFCSIPVRLNGHLLNRPFFGFGVKSQLDEKKRACLQPASRTTDVGGNKIYLVAPEPGLNLIPAPAQNWVGVSKWWQLSHLGDLEKNLLAEDSPPTARLFFQRYLSAGFQLKPQSPPELTGHPSCSKRLLYLQQPMLGCFAILAPNVGTSGIWVVHDGVVVTRIPHRSLFAVLSSQDLELDFSGFALAYSPVLKARIEWLEDWAKS